MSNNFKNHVFEIVRKTEFCPQKMCFVVILYTICLTQKKLNGKVGKALKLLTTALKLIIMSTFCI